MSFAAGEHPRLLFNSRELAYLRAQAAQGLKSEILANLRRYAAACMNPSHPWYLDFRERKRDIWRQRSGIFVVLPTLHTLATAYAFAGDIAAGECARDAVMAIIEHGLADVKSKMWGMESEGWRRGPGHDKGKFAQAMAFVYDLCYHLFTDEQRKRFADFARESIKLALEWWRFDWWQIANNRGVRGILAPFWYAVALEGDAPIDNLEGHVKEAELAVEHFLFLGYGADGAPFEGPGYGGCLMTAAVAAEVLRRRGSPNLLTNNRFERYLEYLTYEMLPGGGAVNNLNDAEPVNGSVTCSLPLIGSARGALLPWLARQLDLHPTRRGSWLDADPREVQAPPGETLLYFLLWWRDDLPVLTPQELGYPLSHCFRARGVASMRTGWEKDDWLLSHFCGRQQYKCHRQGDFNHVAFYALGEKFLVDAGYGNPKLDTVSPVDRWFGETDVHNCVLLNGLHQRGTLPTPGWAEGEMLDFHHTEAFDTSLGDASSCTGPDHRVRRALRRVVLVRRGPVPYVAIVDVNELDGASFLAEARWHTEHGNEVVLNGKRFSIKGKVNECVCEVLWPRDATLMLSDSFTRPQVRVSVRASVAETVTVFCPRRPSEPSPCFFCERESEGKFIITCEQGGRRSKLHVSAVLTGPMRNPLPVTLEA